MPPRAPSTPPPVRSGPRKIFLKQGRLNAALRISPLAHILEAPGADWQWPADFYREPPE